MAATDTNIFPNGQFEGNVTIAGNLSVSGTLPAVTRTGLSTDTSQIIPLKLSDWRVWDAVATNLPGTSATDDLGYITGTFATAGPYIGTSDLKSAGATTRYARCLAVLPPEYVDATDVVVRFSAGMITTVADTSATITIGVYKVSRADGTVGSNLYSGAAVTINSLTFSEKSFTLVSGGLAKGDMLDIRLTMVVTDGEGGAAVIGAVRTSELLLSIKG